MPWPVYSEQFIRTAAQNVWTRYTVPAGHRAVVVSCVAVSASGAANEFGVRIAGINCAFASFQAANSTAVINLRAVAYAGQFIECFTTGQGTYQNVSGYLFRESGLLRRGPPETTEHPMDVAVQLPAELEAVSGP